MRAALFGGAVVLDIFSQKKAQRFAPSATLRLL